MRRVGLVGLLLLISLGCESGDENTGPFGGEELTVVNNRDYFSRVSLALDSAQQSICVVMYVMKYYPEEPTSVNLLLDELIGAQGRGVDVKVVLEGSVNDTVTINHLKEGGISVRLDPEEVTTHAKMVLVDGEVVIFGSTNWTESAIRSNNETNVQIKEASIAEVYEDYFQSLWEVSGDD